MSTLGLLDAVRAGRTVRNIARRAGLRRTAVLTALAEACRAGLVAGPDGKRRWTITYLGDLSLRTGIVQVRS